jgi:hypothetical protein
MSKLRDKLADLLEEAFAEIGIEVSVNPDQLWPATGFYRTSGNDSYCWEGQANVKGTTTFYSLTSYSTMTSIVKSKKATLSRDRTHVSTYDVYDANGN